MKIVKVEDAVGVTLCHDITKIVPGKFKGVAFKKGYVIKPEDIQELLSIGKKHIYIWEDMEGIIHENEAAEKLRDISAGEGLCFGDIKEGKIEFFAAYDGLVKIDSDMVFKMNSVENIILSTIHNNTVVKKGDKLAATKIVPLFIEESVINALSEEISHNFINVLPIKKKKTAIITTGSEVYTGRIKDAFGPVLKEKLDEYNCEILGQSILSDIPGMVEQEIKKWLENGAEMILCTGGMSVDPDDLTPGGIRNSGAEIITYGTPVLPGAMLLMAYKEEVPIIGLPGNVIFSKRTAFDLILPRVLAGEKLLKRDFAYLGHGGLCVNCEICTFPKCGFGKGM
jgi:molybdenum cofactor synthesis domain-containing protein